MRTMHASDAAVGGAARAGRLREHAAALTARTGQPRPSAADQTRHHRHAAAALWRRRGLRQRGERRAVSRGRPGRDPRAAFRQQIRQVKSNKVKLSQCGRARPPRTHLAEGALAGGAEVDAGAGRGGSEPR